MSFILKLIPSLLTSLIALTLLATIVFIGTYYIGDPLKLLMGAQMSGIDIETARANLGLDKSAISQFMHFITGVVSGDMGTSYIFNKPAVQLIVERLPASLELALLAIAISAGIGVPLGLYALRRSSSYASGFIRAYSVLGLSFPLYILALLLISFFAVYLTWLPALGRGETRHVLGLDLSIFTLDGWAHLILPLLSLCLLKIALFIRYTLYFGYSITKTPAIVFAKARGLPDSMIYNRHVLRNILVPLSSLTVIEFGGVLVSAVITENVFAWPGVGKLLIDSIHHADRPVLIVFILFVALFYVLANLGVEVFHRLIDPRLRGDQR